MTTSQHCNAIRPGEQAVEEAAEWLAEAADGELDFERRQAFSRWLRRSPENIAAYLEVAAFWAEVPQGAPPGGFDIAKLVAEAKAEETVVALAGVSAEMPGGDASAIRATRTAAWRRYAAAAVVVATVGASVLVTWQVRGESFRTDIGEQRSLTLVDGSTVQLNARTRLRVRMDDEVRSVTLEEGQALFTVAKDAARPFVVTSGEVRVRAVGTQFDVDRRTTRTTVTVLEGLVAVGGRPEVPAMELPAGQRLVVRAGDFESPEAVNVATATAWTDRRLVFQGTPLGEVVEDFNRFSRRPLVVDDAELAALAISGVYTSTDPASLIRFLRAQPGIRVNESHSRIVITRN